MNLQFDLIKHNPIKVLNKCIITFFALHLVIIVFAQDKTYPTFEGKIIQVNSSLLKSRLRTFTVINLESEKLAEFVHQNTVSTFRLDFGFGKQWNIDLEPSNIVAPNYQLKLQNFEGSQVLISHPNFLFKGKVERSGKNEQVRLAIKEGFVYGSIQTEGEEYLIVPFSAFSIRRRKINT